MMTKLSDVEEEDERKGKSEASSWVAVDRK
jgi:hypothetical protein